MQRTVFTDSRMVIGYTAYPFRYIMGILVAGGAGLAGPTLTRRLVASGYGSGPRFSATKAHNAT